MAGSRGEAREKLHRRLHETDSASWDYVSPHTPAGLPPFYFTILSHLEALLAGEEPMFLASEVDIESPINGRIIALLTKRVAILNFALGDIRGFDYDIRELDAHTFPLNRLNDVRIDRMSFLDENNFPTSGPLQISITFEGEDAIQLPIKLRIRPSGESVEVAYDALIAELNSK